MKHSLILVLLFVSQIVFAQKIYDVDTEIRENSIDVTDIAIKMIEDSNYEGAARILERVIVDDPTFHPAYLNYYRAGSQVEKLKEKVIQTLKDGLVIFEEDDEMSYYLGNILQREKRLPEAIAAYSDAIAFSKINGEEFQLVWAYHFNRGNCYLKTNQFAKAITDYNNALRLSPRNGDVLTNRGFCYYKTNNNSKACADWDEAKSLGNKQTEVYLKNFCK